MFCFVILWFGVCVKHNNNISKPINNSNNKHKYKEHNTNNKMDMPPYRLAVPAPPALWFVWFSSGLYRVLFVYCCFYRFAYVCQRFNEKEPTVQWKQQIPAQVVDSTMKTPNSKQTYATVQWKRRIPSKHRRQYNDNRWILAKLFDSTMNMHNFNQKEATVQWTPMNSCKHMRQCNEVMNSNKK